MGMCGRSLLGLLIFSFGVVAYADIADDIEGGKYTDQKFYRLNDNYFTKFEMLKRGRKLAIRDKEKNIAYTLDVDNPKEQDFPPAFYTKIAHVRQRGSIGPMIQRVWFSDVKVTSDDAIAANLFIQLNYNTKFGWANAKIRMAALISQSICTVQSDSGPPNFTTNNIQTKCLKVESGHELEVTDFNSGFSYEVNKAIGLIFDFLLRTAGTGLYAVNNLYLMK